MRLTRKTSILLIQLVAVAVCLTFFKNQFMVFAQGAPQDTQNNQGAQNMPVRQSQYYYEATIQSITTKGMAKQATVQFTTGSKKGSTAKVDIPPDQKSQALNFKPNDKVIVVETSIPNQPGLLYIADFVRTNQLLMLFALFVTFVVAIGGWKSLLSLAGMAYSFVIIGKFIVPQIVIGNDPILISIFGAILIAPVTFYISHGVSKKTTVSVIGTIVALIFTGILSVIYVNFAHLTGTASEDAMYVQSLISETINLRSLLLAGMIIGALGILDDITISQAAIVQKLFKTGKNPDSTHVFKDAMDIGRDHIASLVNTLVLVYAGASLPLFLLFYNSNLPYSFAISSEVVATEIVRTLVGSIGLVAAVPITTAIACIWMKNEKQ